MGSKVFDFGYRTRTCTVIIRSLKQFLDVWRRSRGGGRGGGGHARSQAVPFRIEPLQSKYLYSLGGKVIFTVDIPVNQYGFCIVYNASLGSGRLKMTVRVRVTAAVVEVEQGAELRSEMLHL